MRFLVGLVLGILVPFLVLGVVIATGVFDMSALRPPGAVERLVGGALVDRSTERRAPKARNPLPLSAEVLRAGLHRYRDDCLGCHGAPGIPPADVGKGLNPPAPELSSADTQDASDGELFWVISRGVRMTGMPAWAATHPDREIWELVAFLRHLRALSPDERKLLGARGEAEGGGAKERQREAPHPAGGGDAARPGR